VLCDYLTPKQKWYHLTAGCDPSKLSDSSQSKLLHFWQYVSGLWEHTNTLSNEAVLFLDIPKVC